MTERGAMKERRAITDWRAITDQQSMNTCEGQRWEREWRDRMPSSTRMWRAVSEQKFEQIPLFIPRGLASPLRESWPPSTFGKVCFFTDFGSVFNRPPCTWRVHGPGRGAARQGKCSSCYVIIQVTTENTDRQAQAGREPGGPTTSSIGDGDNDPALTQLART